MTARKFYRNVFEVEVLSEEPLPDCMSLETIAYQITEGDCSGRIVTKVDNREITGAAVVKRLQAQGSDPSFFGLTENGEELDEALQEPGD